jgi:hypothetical protein
MKEGIQTEIDDPKINSWGCFFLDILKVTELEDGEMHSWDDVKRIFEYSVNMGYINKQNLIVNYMAIYKLAGGSHNKYGKCTSLDTVPVDHCIREKCKKSIKGGMLTHFDVYIKSTGKNWDSLDPKRPTNTGYEVMTYRFFYD